MVPLRLLLVLSLLTPFGTVAQGQSTPPVISINLSPTTAPRYAQPGVTVVTLVGSNFPSGDIRPADVAVRLEPARMSDPTVEPSNPAINGVVTAIQNLTGTSRRVTFQIPPQYTFTSPIPYLVSVSGKSSAGVEFRSANRPSLTINPPAKLVSVTPSSAPAGARLRIKIVGSYTNFLQGVTRIILEPDISVANIVIQDAMTALADITLPIGAADGPRDVITRTGVQEARLPAGF